MNDEQLIKTHADLDTVIAECAAKLADPDSDKTVEVEKDISFIMAAAGDVKWHMEDPPPTRVSVHIDRAKAIVKELRDEAKKLASPFKDNLLERAREIAEDFDLEGVADEIGSEQAPSFPRAEEAELEEEIVEEEKDSPSVELQRAIFRDVSNDRKIGPLSINDMPRGIFVWLQENREVSATDKSKIDSWDYDPKTGEIMFRRGEGKLFLNMNKEQFLGCEDH